MSMNESITERGAIERDRRECRSTGAEGGQNRRIGGEVHVGIEARWRLCSRQRNDSEAVKKEGKERLGSCRRAPKHPQLYVGVCTSTMPAWPCYVQTVSSRGTGYPQKQSNQTGWLGQARKLPNVFDVFSPHTVPFFLHA